MLDKDEAKKKVDQLVNDYKRFASSHDEAEVNEEQVRTAKPFFLFTLLLL